MIIDAHCHAWRKWPYRPPVPDENSRGSCEQPRRWRPPMRNWAPRIPSCTAPARRCPALARRRPIGQSIDCITSYRSAAFIGCFAPPRRRWRQRAADNSSMSAAPRPTELRPRAWPPSWYSLQQTVGSVLRIPQRGWSRGRGGRRGFLQRTFRRAQGSHQPRDSVPAIPALRSRSRPRRSSKLWRNQERRPALRAPLIRHRYRHHPRGCRAHPQRRIRCGRIREIHGRSRRAWSMRL